VQKVNLSHRISKKLSRRVVRQLFLENSPTFLPSVFNKLSQRNHHLFSITDSIPNINHMSPYDGVVIGKLKLKGKPLNLKDGGIKKKNKKHNKSYNYFSEFNSGEYYDLCICLFLMHLTDSNSFL
jgi:hypothetical protein